MIAVGMAFSRFQNLCQALSSFFTAARSVFPVFGARNLESPGVDFQEKTAASILLKPIDLAVELSYS
jgi:hypothetical protein